MLQTQHHVQMPRSCVYVHKLANCQRLTTVEMLGNTAHGIPQMDFGISGFSLLSSFFFFFTFLAVHRHHLDLLLVISTKLNLCLNQSQIIQTNVCVLLTLTVLKLAASSSPLTAAESRLRQLYLLKSRSSFSFSVEHKPCGCYLNHIYLKNRFAKDLSKPY